MNKFENVYILSDMDGTMIVGNHRVSEENKTAINRFVAGGGTFGVATGRFADVLGKFLDGINVNGYSIVSNGAVICDVDTMEIVYSGGMGKEELLPFINSQTKLFPDLCVEIYTTDGILVSDHTDYIDEYIKRENVPHKIVNLQDKKDVEWNKMLFHSPDKNVLLSVQENLKKYNPQSLEGEFSSEFYFEVMPLLHSKGDMLEKLKKMPKFAGKRFIACGDHLNDLAMVKTADVGICPSNAKDQTKAVADLVLGVSNEQHLLKVVIDMIENGEI